MIRKFLTSESGQGLTEYSLIIGFVVLVIITVVATFGSQLKSLYEDIVENWPE